MPNCFFGFESFKESAPDMSSSLVTSTYYLDRDEKFLEEKPYELRFQPPEGFPARNTTWSEYGQIQVTDVRGREEEFTVDNNGFQLCHVESSLAADDFSDPNLVESQFLGEVAHCVKQALGGCRVLVFDYMIRKSVPGYPISSGKGHEHETPATIVHIDTTQAWSEHMDAIYKDKLQGLDSSSKYQYVNFWKPIRGPVKRWPLMLCDWNTYNPQEDVVSRDLVFGDGHVESTVAYHNPSHKYYYLSDQREDEAWIMVQSDSSNGRGVLHTSFPNPLTRSDDPERHSIEVRCMVYF